MPAPSNARHISAAYNDSDNPGPVCRWTSIANLMMRSVDY
jgi:hypothetical protein